jgi:hypothetical protein
VEAAVGLTLQAVLEEQAAEVLVAVTVVAEPFPSQEPQTRAAAAAAAQGGPRSREAMVVQVLSTLHM